MRPYIKMLAIAINTVDRHKMQHCETEFDKGTAFGYEEALNFFKESVEREYVAVSTRLGIGKIKARESFVEILAKESIKEQRSIFRGSIGEECEKK